MTPQTSDGVWDAVILGAGPAGSSCALWLKLLGLQPIVIDARPAVGGRLADSPYANPWVALLPPDATGLTIASGMAEALAAQDVALRLGERAVDVGSAAEGFAVTLAGGESLAARAVVLATGLATATGGLAPAEGLFFGPGQAVFDHDFRGLSVAILGGGDNAFEHAAFAAGKGASEVRVFARTVRARAGLVAAVPPTSVVRTTPEVDAAARTVDGRRYDRILVMYGFAPSLPRLTGLAPRLGGGGYVATDPATAESSVPGLYAIGDVSGRAHPSVPTALGDGVVAAKAIEAARIRKP